MVETAAINGRQQIAQIEKLMDGMGNEIQKQLPKIYSKGLMEVLFQLPYTKRVFLERAGLGTYKTVSNYLNELVKAGFLNSVQVGKEMLYLNTRLMNILKN